MSSNVLYKFRSQKDPSRITFDGTGISVFEVKREIIKRDIRTDGRDLDLLLYNKDTTEEYTDDTIVIPRSTLLEAVRRPAARPGQGRCARYLNGPMPTIAKSSYQRAAPQSNATSVANGQAANRTTGGEDDEETAAIRARDNYWEQEKQKMAGATPVFYSKKPGSKPNDAKLHPERRGPPSHPYVCHRCSKPGHWIEECPTNGDEKFNNRPRYKRATGIPRSNLEVIEDDEDSEDDGLNPGKRHTVMINELGQRVRARPDEVAWEQHKAKVDASKEKQQLAAQDSDELEAQGLLCSIDKRAFVNPAKTPCCGKTYCHDCIENALLDSGLVCPGCDSENIFVEALLPDNDVAVKIKTYEDAKKPKEISRPNSASGSSVKSAEGGSAVSVKLESTPEPAPAIDTPLPKSPLKRPAEDELPNDRQGRAPGSAEKPKAKSKSPSQEPDPKPAAAESSQPTPIDAPRGPAADRNTTTHTSNAAHPNMAFPMMDMNSMNAMGMNPMMMGMMPGYNTYGGFPPNMNMNMMGMGMGGMNNSMMNNMNGMTMPQNNSKPNMNNFHMQPHNNFNNGNTRGGKAGYQNNYNNNRQPYRPNGNMTQRAGYNNHNHNFHSNNGSGFKNGGRFNNQNSNSDGAYDRAPVNGRGRNGASREMRPAEYKEL